MKIRLRISLVVAIIAVVGLLYLQYVWIQKLYLSEQKRIRITAISELDVVMADELIIVVSNGKNGILTEVKFLRALQFLMTLRVWKSL